MAKYSIKTGFGLSLKTLGIALLGSLLFSGCDNGSNNADPNAYVTMSIAKSTASGGNVTVQQLSQYTSIIITVRDDKGYSISGDIQKNNGNLTLTVKPYTALTVSGVAYEGSIATLEGTQRVKALRPGEVANVNFTLNPITPPPAKPAPLVTPADGAIGVPLNTQLTADMSFLAEDIASLDSASLTLTTGAGATINTGYIAPDGGFSLSFILPDGVFFDLSTEYAANLEVNYTDNTGTAKTFSYPWSFTTTVFTDTDLASCVYDTMRANGQHNYSDVTDLDCSGNNYYYNVRDLAGMQYLTNLRTFDVSMYCDCSGNFITDLSPLSGLQNLVSLNLGYNLNISNLAPITGLKSLQALTLSGNGITDLSAWSGLTNLVSFDLSYNNISDVSPLAGFTNLQDLDLSYNSVSDLSQLSGLTTLQNLDISRNGVVNLAGLSTLANLQRLKLYYNQITDITQLSGLANLHDLDLSYNQITDISPLSGMGALQLLNLSNNLITDATAINSMSGLVNAELGGNNISTVSLVGFPNMTKIGFSGNKITTFSINGSMPKLVSLDVSYNYVTVFQLAGTATDYPDMYDVYLQSNNINDVSALGKMGTLQYLYLSNNNVEDASPLSPLTGLKMLMLDGNNVKTGVMSLNQLASAYMNFNNNPLLPCTDIQGLDQSLDGGNGGTTGNIVWNKCFTDAPVSGLSFVDQNLAACVDKAISSVQPPITNAGELTSLSCPSAGIANIAGLAKLAKLQSLDLSGNSIVDFSELSNMRDLKTLNIGFNRVTNLAFLASLRNLQTLNLDFNPFTTLTGVYPSYVNMGYLTNIVTLTLGDNQINTSLQSLTTLFNAQTIDLNCSPSGLVTEINILDQALDGGDGASSGVVIWSLSCA